MNYSEYVAIMSGNTDLLEKAKLEKRIAAMESEHRSFNKGLGDSRARLRDINDEVEKLEIIIGKMEADNSRYAAVVQRDSEGNPLNVLKLDNCQFTDEERMGKYLQALVKNTNTHGEYVRVGEVYDFPVCIISEKAVVDGVEAVRNRFVVEGQYKYTYNNGNLAMSDSHAACMNFVNVLEKLPDTISQHRERADKNVSMCRPSKPSCRAHGAKKTNLKPSNPNLPPSTAKSPLPLLPRMRNRTAKKTNNSPTPKGSKYVITNLRLPARRRRWLRNLFIYMPHVVLSPDYDRETEPAADEIIKCCRFCFCDIKSKMGYKFHDYLILF